MTSTDPHADTTVAASFRRIAVPIDFREGAARALDVAIDLAERLDAEIVLLHAFQIDPMTYAAGVYVDPTEMRNAAQGALDEVLTETKRRHAKTTAKVVDGPAWQVLGEAAREVGADVVVMGTHGRKGLGRWLIGSVTEQLLRTAGIPVLAVTPERADGRLVAARRSSTTSGSREA